MDLSRTVAHNDIFDTSLDAEIDGTTTATTQSTNDEDSREAATLGLASFDRLLDVVNEETLVLVWGNTWKRAVLAIDQLM